MKKIFNLRFHYKQIVIWGTLAAVLSFVLIARGAFHDSRIFAAETPTPTETVTSTPTPTPTPTTRYPTPTPTFHLHVNFQPTNAPTPPRIYCQCPYCSDYGLPYGTRPCGHNHVYGWTMGPSPTPFRFNGIDNCDQRLKTSCSFRTGDEWEARVPYVGNYFVTVGLGMVTTSTTVGNLMVENNLYWNNYPNLRANEFIQFTQLVYVWDGNVTISGGSDTTYINFVHIVPQATPSRRGTSVTPTRTFTPTPTPIITYTPTLTP